jgi:hypothetical protein
MHGLPAWPETTTEPGRSREPASALCHVSLTPAKPPLELASQKPKTKADRGEAPTIRVLTPTFKWSVPEGGTRVGFR